MKINLQKMIIGAILITSSVSVFAAPKFNSKKSISVLSREDGSGTRGAFIELFGIEKKDANGKKVDYTTNLLEVEKLVHKNYKVAICEQLEDPKSATGLVKRGVTRIVTTGTLTEGELHLNTVFDNLINRYNLATYA